eukprot:1185984-Prorocentrum_minimum.AAC.3
MHVIQNVEEIHGCSEFQVGAQPCYVIEAKLYSRHVLMILCMAKNRGWGMGQPPRTYRALRSNVCVIHLAKNVKREHFEDARDASGASATLAAHLLLRCVGLPLPWAGHGNVESEPVLHRHVRCAYGSWSKREKGCTQGGN